jgi:uncharacterized protein involved in outer membrane biogenesis
MRKLLVVILVVALVFLSLSLAKDMIAKSIFVSGLRAMTGLEVSISSFKIGLIRQVVNIRNLTILNPGSFKEKILATIPEVYIEVDLGALFNGKVHLKKVRIDLAELVVVTNASGQVNLNSIHSIKAWPEGQKRSAAIAEERASGKLPPFLVDELSQKIGRVMYKDHRGGGSPSEAEYNIGLDETFRDVSDPYQLVNVIVVRALMYTPIGNIAGFDIGSLQNSVAGMMAIPNSPAGSFGGKKR